MRCRACCPGAVLQRRVRGGAWDPGRRPGPPAAAAVRGKTGCGSHGAARSRSRGKRVHSAPRRVRWGGRQRLRPGRPSAKPHPAPPRRLGRRWQRWRRPRRGRMRAVRGRGVATWGSACQWRRRLLLLLLLQCPVASARRGRASGTTLKCSLSPFRRRRRRHALPFRPLGQRRSCARLRRRSCLRRRCLLRHAGRGTYACVVRLYRRDDDVIPVTPLG